MPDPKVAERAKRIVDAYAEAMEEGKGAVSVDSQMVDEAMNKDHHAVGALRRTDYDVDPLDSSCCGMAGSLGYETEHYDLSQAIGNVLFEQIAESPGETVTAPGGSCRSQFGDHDGCENPPHPIEKVANVYRGR